MEGHSITITSHLSIPFSEISFRTSRSSGPGGQNVNKVESRVELIFDVANSPTLTEAQRAALAEHLKQRIDTTGLLRIVVQRSRSQYQNKELALERFAEALRHALRRAKPRLKTKPSKSAKVKRLESKRHQSDKKRLRKRYLE
jgi:ribosome-associated protein